MAATEDGDTPLHLAAAAGHLGIIEDLLRAGADLGCRGKDAYTPLHTAAERGQADAVRSLLERGASPAAVTQFGSTPLQLAVHESHGGVIKAIIATAGGELGLATTVPEYHPTPLHFACHAGDLTLVAALIKHGVDAAAKTQNQRWHRTRISIELASLCSFSATGVRFGEVHLSSSPIGRTAAGVDATTLSSVGLCVEVLHTAPIDKHLVATLDEWAVLISSGDEDAAGRVAEFVQQQLCRIPSRIQLWEMAQQAAAVLGCTPFLELALDIRLLRAFAVWKRLGLTDFPIRTDIFASETMMMDALLQLPSINPRSRPEAERRRVMSVSEFESLATKLEAKAAWRDSGDSLGVQARAAQCASTLWHLGLSPTLSVEESRESMVAQGSGVYATLTLPHNPGALPYMVDEIQAEASSHGQGWSDSPDGQGVRSSCTWGELRVVLPPGHGAEAATGTPPGDAVMVWDDQGRAFTNRHADFRWQNHPPAVRTAARGSSLVSALNTGPGGSLAGGAQVRLLMCAEGPGGCCYVRRAAVRLVLRPVRHIE
ncbi:hypothetical protein GPECTOR_158g100 [Gonium pectorale]|uniref:Uncharacterized protein n=1 Tax=Gonium pectorale TaxID=33097 RepID=A0A150FXM0_GONPE|nr:hypothetical protein GPECTOR_158g100 [Gonium pectorale]|eukprot:KXZ42346.1 hypothetical protein GPECTOR_158g100 [Gonium pectorale]